LSALDVKMRLKLQNEIVELHKKMGLTVIMVTHDPSEIYRLASRVLLFEDGKIVGDGSAKEVLMGDEKGLKGEILEINTQEVVTLLVGQQLIELKLPPEEVESLKVGDFYSLNH